MKKVIVYSALHTGTAFTCNIISTNATGKILSKDEGYWLQPILNCSIEDLINGETLTDERIEEIIKDKIEETFDLDTLVLQIHQRYKGSLYQSLYQSSPEIPVVVPIRDPLLSINTRIWRETGAIQKFQQETSEYRIARAKDQLDSIIRLLKLPKENVIFFPIDIERNEDEKIEVLRNLLNSCNLSANERLTQSAKKWSPVNTTVNGDFAQKNLYPIEEKEFVSIKEAILAGDTETVNKHLSIEFKLLQDMLKSLKTKFTDLGYKKLCWW
jgi:hypothetical protein